MRSLLLAFWSIVVASSFGCSSAATEIDCATADVKPFSELSSSFIYCTSCHGQNKADSGVRYDTYEAAVRHAQAAEDTIADGSMPPGGDMPEAEAEAIYAWVQCGTPE